MNTDYLLGKKQRDYDDLLAHSKISMMFRGIMKLPERDKETMLEFYEFLKNKHIPGNLPAEDKENVKD